MLSILETILSPVVWIMQSILEFFFSIIPSMGISILLLSCTFALFLLPLQKIAQRIEERTSSKMQTVNEQVQALKGELRGEKLFLATEKIYDQHGYHPIESIKLGASLFVMLPVLISAIFLFSGDGVSGKSFLFITDLSKPDGLLGPINVLPFVMTMVTFIDARIRFRDDKQSQYRFFFISIVLLVLVYNLASGLVLYWTGSNIMSFILSRIQSR